MQIKYSSLFTVIAKIKIMTSLVLTHFWVQKMIRKRVGEMYVIFIKTFATAIHVEVYIIVETMHSNLYIKSESWRNVLTVIESPRPLGSRLKML